jgi:hypothetical protein
MARAAALHRRLEIDRATVSRAARVVSKALQEEKLLTRGALYRLLESVRIPVEGERGLHILWLLANQGLICFGPRREKQHTFALLEEWLPGVPAVPRDVALAMLAERYFSSHGPATLQDFAWWTGLAASDAREGLEMAKSRLAGERTNGSALWMNPSAPPHPAPAGVFLLPAFDEYMVGYSDRDAPLEVTRSRQVPVTAAQALSSLVLRDGMVVGTWRRTLEKGRVIVTASFFVPPTRKDRDAFKEATRSYGKFLGLPVTLPQYLAGNTRRGQGGNA